MSGVEVVYPGHSLCISVLFYFLFSILLRSLIHLILTTDYPQRGVNKLFLMEIVIDKVL